MEASQVYKSNQDINLIPEAEWDNILLVRNKKSEAQKPEASKRSTRKINPSPNQQAVETIKKKIEETFSSEILKSLSDESLVSVYRDQPSMKKKLIKIRNQFESVGIEDSKIDAYIDKYFIDLIEPGLKGQIRGTKFNCLVREYLLNLPCASKYEIEFEKQHPLFQCSDKPDFYIYDQERKKLLIGMNQIDLWEGGQQKNRQSKYVTDERFHENFPNAPGELQIKVVSVICRKPEYQKLNKSLFSLFQIGFTKNRLCYVHGLKEIIDSLFQEQSN